MSESDRFIPPEVRGLRDGVEAPDLSRTILQEVERRQGWLSRRQRRMLCVARWGAASVLLGVLGGVLLVERFTQVGEMVVPEQRALADLMKNVQNETSEAVQSVSTQVRSLPAQLVNQSRLFVAARMERQGDVRVVELAGPAVVVDEATMGVGYIGQARRFAGQYRTGVGLSWPASLNTPAERQSAVFQDVGLERVK